MFMLPFVNILKDVSSRLDRKREVHALRIKYRNVSV